jgi:hypothetical protein
MLLLNGKDEKKQGQYECHDLGGQTLPATYAGASSHAQMKYLKTPVSKREAVHPTLTLSPDRKVRKNAPSYEEIGEALTIPTRSIKRHISTPQPTAREPAYYTCNHSAHRDNP